MLLVKSRRPNLIYPKKFLTKIYAKGLMNKDTLSKYLKTDFLYDQLPGGFISYHPDGSILRVNETFCKWMNISNEDICKLNFRSILNQASQLYYDRVKELTEESRDLFKMLQTSVQELDEMIKIASNTMITPTY